MCVCVCEEKTRKGPRLNDRPKRKNKISITGMDEDANGALTAVVSVLGLEARNGVGGTGSAPWVGCCLLIGSAPVA